MAKTTTQAVVEAVSTPTQDRHKRLIPSLEGMRAIAVLAVMLFHVDLHYLQGGFVGVDLFFVISGFIITRNILKERDEGRFSFSRFYHRRIRRLLPALAVTVIVTLLAAYVFLPAADFMATGQAALYSIVSLSNILFWTQAGYFDAASHTKPLLHTWSLSVEEQFYLFWPITIYLVWRSRLSLWLRKFIAIFACLLLAAVSVGAAYYFVQDHPGAVFFLGPFRVYQFMAGALVAVAGLSLRGVIGSTLCLMGLALFCAAAYFLSGEVSPLVSGVAVAVAGLLLLVSRDAFIARWLLGNTLAVWIGGRSYALYLVHWPIIVIYKYATDFELSVAEQVGLFAASIVAAELLYRLVETPLRVGPATPQRLVRAGTPITAALVFTGLFASANVWGHRGLETRNPEEIQTLLQQVETSKTIRLAALRTQVCHSASGYRLQMYDEAVCAPIRRNRTNVLIIGDSIAADIYLALEKAYPNVSFSQATGGSCGPFVDLNAYTGCEELNAFRFNELLNRDYDFVVFATRWRPNRISDIQKSIQLARAAGKRVVIFGPGVQFTEEVPRLISTTTSLAEAELVLQANEDRQGELASRLQSAVSADATFVDLVSLQCSDTCAAIENGKLLYIDRFHLSVDGADYVARRLASQMPELFAK